MIARCSAEEFLAELDNIIGRFRAESSAMVHKDFGREEAVHRLRKLGFTAGRVSSFCATKKT